MILTPKNWNSFQHYKDRSPPWIKLHRGLLDDMEYHSLSPEAAKALPLIWLIASERDGQVPAGAELAFRLRISHDLANDIVTELMGAHFLVESDAKTAEQSATLAQRKAKENGFGNRHIPDATKREVWERDGGRCTNCGSEENVEYDHKHPVSKGGNSEKDNIQLLCRPCNRSKRTRVATQPLNSRSLETETQDQTEKRRVLDAEASREWSAFEEFWKVKPTRAGADPKSPAAKLFQSAVKAGTPAETIVAAAKRWRIVDAAKVGTEYIPQAVKWLRDKRWNDYGPEVDKPPDEKISIDDAIQLFAKTGKWSRHAPVSDISQVPAELLEKHGLLADGRRMQ